VQNTSRLIIKLLIFRKGVCEHELWGDESWWKDLKVKYCRKLEFWMQSKMNKFFNFNFKTQKNFLRKNCKSFLMFIAYKVLNDLLLISLSISADIKKILNIHLFTTEHMPHFTSLFSSSSLSLLFWFIYLRSITHQKKGVQRAAKKCEEYIYGCIHNYPFGYVSEWFQSSHARKNEIEVKW
jgi:hypothetical protein